MDKLDLQNLDPGIRCAVRVLRASGVDTFESCEGGPGHGFPTPRVLFLATDEEAFSAFRVAVWAELSVWDLRKVYPNEDGEIQDPHWELVFYAALSAAEFASQHLSIEPGRDDVDSKLDRDTDPSDPLRNK